MCLLLIANRVNKNFKLVIAANRDEFYDRPTQPAEFWEEHPDVLAGRDLRGGGTWLGITKSGKMAAVTNYRSGLYEKQDAPSRGNLTKDFLTGQLSRSEYLEKIKTGSKEYNKFNLVFGTPDELLYFSNVSAGFQEIGKGIYGLSNCLLDTPWPKVVSSKLKLQEVLAEDGGGDTLIKLLGDRYIYPDHLLPETGMDIELERYLSAVFIKTPIYGTRASTVIRISNDNEVTFIEKTFDSSGETGERIFRFFIR